MNYITQFGYRADQEPMILANKQADSIAALGNKIFAAIIIVGVIIAFAIVKRKKK